MKKFLTMAILAFACTGLALPAEALARHRRPPQPALFIVMAHAEPPQRVTWQVPRPGGRSAPVFRFHGRYWTWHDGRWYRTKTRWDRWHGVAVAPKQIRALPLERIVLLPAPGQVIVVRR